MIAGSAYREHRPTGPLAEFVECLWWTRGEGGGRTAVLPDGCVDLLFERHPPQHAARVVGTMRRPRVVHCEGPYELLAVRFRAGGASALLNLDVREVVDNTTSWRPDAPQRWVLEACQRDSDVQAAASALEDHLTRRIASVRPRDRACLESAAACVTHPQRSVVEVAESLGVSRQQFRKRVVAATGLGPKQLSRIARFRRVAGELAIGVPPSAALALENGYCDQAHMANEFRALSGSTASAYARFHSSKTVPSSPH
ncbi:MAG: DUF6597 domain-containing transcriptional factor [Nannocystales bacterium]